MSRPIERHTPILIEHRGRPSTTPPALARSKRLSAYAKAAWAVLDSWSDPHPSLELLAELVPCSRRRAVQAVQELAFEGWVVVLKGNRRRGEANRYVLNHECAPIASLGGQETLDFREGQGLALGVAKTSCRCEEKSSAPNAHAPGAPQKDVVKNKEKKEIREEATVELRSPGTPFSPPSCKGKDERQRRKALATEILHDFNDQLRQRDHEHEPEVDTSTIERLLRVRRKTTRQECAVVAATIIGLWWGTKEEKWISVPRLYDPRNFVYNVNQSRKTRGEVPCDDSKYAHLYAK